MGRRLSAAVGHLGVESRLTVNSEFKVRVELDDTAGFELLLAEVSARFVNVPAEQLDHEIEHALRDICECLGIEHCSLWQADPQNPDVLRLTHVHRDPGLRPRPDRMLGSESFPWAQARLLAGEIVCVEDTTKPPPGTAVDRITWREYSIKSTLALPLSVGGGPIFGVLGFESTSRPCRWTKSLQKRLRLIAEILANGLDRRNAERSLRESQQRLSLAAECANAGLWTIDIAAGTVWGTDNAFKLFGFDSAEPMDFERLITHVHPDDRRRVRRRIARALETGHDAGVTYRVLHRDGSVRWLVSRGRLHSGSHNGSHILTGVTIDITESKLLEQERARFAGRLLKAQEEERERIARELHDDLGQAVALLGLRLQHTVKKLKEGVAFKDSALEALVSMAKRIGDQVSAISHKLHSSELDLLGLAFASEALCRQFSEGSEIRITCTCKEVPGDLGHKAEVALYRVLQEALHNAVKHSRARSIEVRLEVAESGFRLRVKDDGTGFDHKQRRSRQGLGLTSMSERMRLLGGKLKILSRRGQGTTIEALVPPAG